MAVGSVPSEVVAQHGLSFGEDATLALYREMFGASGVNFLLEVARLEGPAHRQQPGEVRELAVRVAAPLVRAVANRVDVLQAGGADARSTLLTSNVLLALANPAGAHLWACITEAAEGQPTSVQSMATAIERAASTMAGLLFASELFT